MHRHTLSEIVDNAHPALLRLSLNEVKERPAPDKWSKQEILGHLIDSAYNNHRRFLQAKNKSDLIFDGYDQDLWVISNQYQRRDWQEIVETWHTVNIHLGHLLKSLAPDLVVRETRIHSFHQICMNLLMEGETTCLAYLIWDYHFHMEHHLGQILPNYQRVTPPYDQLA